MLRISDADPGCFIRDLDLTIFSSGYQIRILTFFHPGSRMLHENWNANLLTASYAFRIKVLVIVKKIQDPEQIYPGSSG
jgi:hypothetical protein